MLSFLRQAAPRQQVGVQTIQIHVMMTLSVTAQRRSAGVLVYVLKAAAGSNR
jgi:hypothetical protein